MTDQYIPLSENSQDSINSLATQFQSESEKNQLQYVPKLVYLGEPGWAILREFLAARQSAPPNLVMGKAYQALYQTQEAKNLEFLTTYFPGGVLKLQSERNIDYQPLQQLLIEQNFQAADTLTREKLCELAGAGAIQRKWVYFTEVEKFPAKDLYIINQLWWLYSEGKFGFGVQRQIWLSVGKDFTKLWPIIGWKTGNIWTKYPHQFTWGLNAPVGHLPLLNQLRGVRVIASLFAHPVWSQDFSST